jgi:hypothetical protein
MKNLILLIFTILTTSLNAQVIATGIRGGLSSSMSIDDIKLINTSSKEEFLLSMSNKTFGYHFGALVRIKLGPLFVQPEVIFNSNSFDISFQDVNKVSTNIGKQKFQYIDVPVLVGLKFGPLRVNAGPTGHLFLNNTKDLFDVNNYAANFSKISVAYTMGVGLDLGSFMLDVRYDDNLSDNNPLVEFTEGFTLSTRPPRLSASVGFKF